MRVDTKFHPIMIVLETKQEAEILAEILNNSSGYWSELESEYARDCELFSEELYHLLFNQGFAGIIPDYF